MSLSSILEQIKQVKPFAEENTDTGPYETLNTRRGRKRQSIEQLKELKFKYREALRENALFIIVTGSGRDAFTEFTTNDFKCFSSDPESFYKDLAKRIPEALYKGRESIGGVFDVMGRHLYDKMIEMGAREYNQLIFRQGYRKNVTNLEELTDLIKTAVNDQMGSEIVGITSIHELTDQAIAKEHATKFTPVVLNTGDDKLALSLSKSLKLLTQNVFVVMAGEETVQSGENFLAVREVNKKSVGQVLTKIKASFKTKN